MSSGTRLHTPNNVVGLSNTLRRTSSTSMRFLSGNGCVFGQGCSTNIVAQHVCGRSNMGGVIEVGCVVAFGLLFACGNIFGWKHSGCHVLCHVQDFSLKHSVSDYLTQWKSKKNVFGFCQSFVNSGCARCNECWFLSFLSSSGQFTRDTTRTINEREREREREGGLFETWECHELCLAQWSVCLCCLSPLPP